MQLKVRRVNGEEGEKIEKTKEDGTCKDVKNIAASPGLETHVSKFFFLFFWILNVCQENISRRFFLEIEIGWERYPKQIIGKRAHLSEKIFHHQQEKQAKTVGVRIFAQEKTGLLSTRTWNVFTF